MNIIIDPPTPEDGTCARCGRSKAEVRGVPAQTGTDHPFKDKAGMRKGANTGKHSVAREAELDPFCSADCCRIYYGLQDPTPLRRHRGRRCAECGCPLDSRTEGCTRCAQRHYARRRAERRRAKVAPTPA